MATARLIFDIIARDSTRGAFNSAAGNVGKFKAAAVVGIGAAGAALGAFGAQSLKAASNFDSTLRQMSAVAGVPQKELKSLSALALKMGADTKFSAQQAADAMLELSKGGLTTAEIKGGALKETLTLAAAGGLELGDAAKTISNALHTFGLSAADAGQASAALAGAANASSADVQDLAFGLAQVGPGARNAGISIQETTAALAAFSNAGLSGSDAGTSFKTFLTRLVPTTKAAYGAMSDLGLAGLDAQKMMAYLQAQGVKPLGTSVEALSGQIRGVLSKQLGGVAADSSKVNRAFGDLVTSSKIATSAFVNQDGSFKSLSEISGALAKALGGLSQEQRTVALSAIFGSDATRAATVLANEGAAGIEKLTAATSNQAAANDVAAANMKGLKGALEQLTGSWETLSVQVGLALAPMATKAALFGTAVLNNVVPAAKQIGQAIQPAVPVVKGLYDVLSALIGFVDKHDTVFGSLAAGVIAFTVAANASRIANLLATTALRAYIVTAQFAILATGKLRAAIIAVNLAMHANPIGLVIAALAGLAAGLTYAYKNSETFRRIVNSAFSGVASAGKSMWENVLRPTFGFLLKSWLFVAAGILTAATKAFGWAPGIGDKLRKAKGEFDKFRTGVLRALDMPDQEINVTARARVFDASGGITNGAGSFNGTSYPRPTRRARGGAVWGAGTATSDSIPAMLSNGEYVVREKAARRIGYGNLDRLNRYANGGLVVNARVPRVADIADPFERIIDRLVARTREVAQARADRAANEIGGDGGGGGMGYRRQMAILRAAFPGLALISGFRPGARTTSGNVSYHARGRAVDIPPRMDVFNWIRSNYGRSSRELIFSPAGGRQLNNGRPHMYTGAVRRMHFNHVHWAMANGGVIREPVVGTGLRSGDSYSFAERGPERVVPLTGRSAARSAPLHVHIHVSGVLVGTDVRRLAQELGPALRDEFARMGRSGYAVA